MFTKSVNINMLSGNDIDDLRESFAIQSTIVNIQLEEMLEKTKQLESLIRLLGPKYVDVEEDKLDVYKPSCDMELPPKKKVRVEIIE